MAVSACASLPRGGPSVGEMLAEAEAAEPAAPFVLVDLTLPVIRQLSAAPPAEGLAAGPALRGSRLSPGDRVVVTLFEATGGGVLSGGQSSDGGAMRTLPPQTIDPQGRVRIPYAGPVRIGGLDTAAAAASIERALAGQIIEPQAIVALSDSPSGAVTVVGDAVTGGGRVPFAGAGDRILDVIAASGGFSRPLHDTVVRLNRDGRITALRADALMERPDQNVPVRPGDVVSVQHAPKQFVILGAVGKAAQIPFEQPRLKLAAALGRGAGLLDERANPEGVFLIRPGYDPAVLGLPGATLPAGGQAPLATVFRLDLTRPSGFLVAQQFEVADGDVIFVANADITPFEKVLRLVGLTLAPVNSAVIFGNVLGN